MADLNVVAFDARASRREEVVELAQEILAMAEAGGIVDLSYAAAKPDGSFETGFTTTDNAPLRLAAVSRLAFRFHRNMDEMETSI